MQLFYTADRNEHTFTLDGDDHRHCTKVLRRKEGDTIIATDGTGQELHGVIQNIKRNETQLKIVNSIIHSPSRHKRVIAIGPTKNMSRYEWFLEKATEIGIDEVAPILCRYSERKSLKVERCQKIIVSAMKQSLRFFQPIHHELLPISKCLAHYQHYKHKYIAYVPEDISASLGTENIDGDVVVFIGPEGGYSEEEIEIAKSMDYKVVSLGPSRLRTETAGLVACHFLNINNV